MSGRKPTDDELRQWHAAMRGVRPLSGARPSVVPPTAVRSRATPARDTSRSGAKPATNPTPAKPSPRPQDRSGERQIRRGQQAYSAVLDLHGHTQESAWSLLPAFLSTAQRRGQKCVMVITGKGRGGDGVLRRNFLRWLEANEAAPLVSGYAQAHPRHGGRGAWYVFVRKAQS